jgi:hypothetical protein
MKAQPTRCRWEALGVPASYADEVKAALQRWLPAPVPVNRHDQVIRVMQMPHERPSWGNVVRGNARSVWRDELAGMWVLLSGFTGVGHPHLGTLLDSTREAAQVAEMIDTYAERHGGFITPEALNAYLEIASTQPWNVMLKENLTWLKTHAPSSAHKWMLRAYYQIPKHQRPVFARESMLSNPDWWDIIEAFEQYLKDLLGEDYGHS